MRDILDIEMSENATFLSSSTRNCFFPDCANKYVQTWKLHDFKIKLCHARMLCANMLGSRFIGYS